MIDSAGLVGFPFRQDVLEDTHNRTVRSCAWSPDGRLLATASFDATTAVWEYNGADFECVATLEVSSLGLRIVAGRPRHRLLLLLLLLLLLCSCGR